MHDVPPANFPLESNPSNKHQICSMVASVLHLVKHLWNAERRKEEEERGESHPLPLTHIALCIPHQGHTNSSTLLESSSLYRQNKSQEQQVGEPQLHYCHRCSVI